MLSNTQFRILSVFFFLLALSNIVIAIYTARIHNLLWFCFFVLLLFTAGLALKNTFMISTVVTSTFLISIVWSIDVLSYFVLDRFIFGATGYIAESGILALLATMYHFIVLFVSVFISLSIGKFHKHSWIGASLFAFFVFVITRVLTSHNVNCVHNSCSLILIGRLKDLADIVSNYIPHWIINWVYLTLVVFIPTHYFFRIVIRWINKK